MDNNANTTITPSEAEFDQQECANDKQPVQDENPPEVKSDNILAPSAPSQGTGDTDPETTVEGISEVTANPEVTKPDEVKIEEHQNGTLDQDEKVGKLDEKKSVTPQHDGNTTPLESIPLSLAGGENIDGNSNPIDQLPKKVSLFNPYDQETDEIAKHLRPAH